jgi:hypothetical protein
MHRLAATGAVFARTYIRLVADGIKVANDQPLTAPGWVFATVGFARRREFEQSGPNPSCIGVWVMDFVKRSVFKCPANGCGLEAKLVRAAVQEFIHPVSGEKAAYYIVECARHGEKLITKDLQPVIHQNRDPTRRRPTPVTDPMPLVAPAPASNGKN